MKIYKCCLFSLFFIIICNQMVLAQNDINKLDEKGNKNGLWKGVYTDSKRPRYEGTFEHGKEVGIFTFFDDTNAKSILATREFNKNNNSAYTIFYDSKKNKVSEGMVVSKVYEGQWIYYHQASKTIMTTENYKNGKLEGIRSVYYPSGKIAEETSYKNNIKEGFYKKYTEKGIILEDTFYKNGQFSGPTTYNDPDGNTVAKGIYKDGKKIGSWQFFENGKVVSQPNKNSFKATSKRKAKPPIPQSN